MAASVAAMSAFAGTSSCSLNNNSSSSVSSLSSPSPARGAISLRRRSFHGSPLGLGSSLQVRRNVPSFSVRATSTDERSPSFSVSGTSTEEATTPDVSKQLQDLFEDLKAKYDSLENKSSVWLYGGGALVAIWLSSTIVGAINAVPLLPKIMELIGLGYTGWFVYRYVLFKSSRKQLAADLEELKLKITGVPRGDFLTEDDE